MGGADSFREALEIDAEQFVGVKGVKARGRRVTTFNVASVSELEPLRLPEPESDKDIPDDDLNQTEESAQDEDNAEYTDDGQLSLF